MVKKKKKADVIESEEALQARVDKLALRKLRKEKKQEREVVKSSKMSAQELVEDVAGEERRLVRAGMKAGLKKVFTKAKASKKRTKVRQTATRKLLGAFGVMGAGQQAGPGRPKGSYKYGMPIHKYKALQRNKRIMMEEYRQQQVMTLRRRGLSPEQVQEQQMQRTVQERIAVQRQPQQTPREINIMEPRNEKQMQRARRNSVAQQAIGVADDELNFRRWAAQNSVSPNTQRMLVEIRRIQNKGKKDNIEQQRRHEERRMVGRQMSLFKAHLNLAPSQLDFTGVSNENILMAPSVFKENPEDNILRPKRLNILQTKEVGNSLFF